MMKKSLLLTILLLNAVFIGTAWGQTTPKELPYEYGFEYSSGTYTEALENEGWTTNNCVSYTHIGSYTSNSGTYCFIFSDADPSQYLISPAMNGSNGINVSFYYKAVNSHGDETFQVGYSSTTADISEFEWDDEIETDSEEWIHYEKSFSGDIKYIAISYNSDNEWGLCVDDFNFDVITKSLPYEYGFEYTGGTYTEALENEGWTPYNCDSHTHIGNYTSHSGTYCFIFSDADPSQYLISPALNGSNGINVSFYYRASNSHADEIFQVGYSSTTTDISEFTWDNEIETDSEEWIHYEKNFSGNIKYIAISYNSDNEWGLFVDDFRLTAPNLCPEPTNIDVFTAPTSAIVTWESDTDSWNLRYKDEYSSWIEIDNLVEKTYTIENLKFETSYEVQLQTVCDENNSSKWTTSVAFTTQPTPSVTVNSSNPSFIEDFDGDELNWRVVNGDYTNKWEWGNAVYGGDNKSIYISNNGGTNNQYTYNSTSNVFVTKTFTLSEASYTFSYDWKVNGESVWTNHTTSGQYYSYFAYDYLFVALVPANEVVDPSYNYGLNHPDGWVSLTSGNSTDPTEPYMYGLLYTSYGHSDDGHYNSGNNDIHTMSVTRDIPSEGDYKVVIIWKNTNSNGNNDPGAIDNFSIEMVAKPTEVTVSPVVTSANITWNPSYENETAWLLYYSTTDTDPADDLYSGENVITVSDNPTYNITGLTSEITYYVWVRSKFGGSEYSAWTRSVAFTPTNKHTLLTNNEDYYRGAFPVDCGHISTGTQSQFIINSSNLEMMANSQIEKITFYSDEPNDGFGDAQFKVYFKEIDEDGFTTTTFYEWDDMTKVYDGSLTLVNYQLDVVLSSPYHYSNKNLLIGFVVNNGTNSSAYWKGLVCDNDCNYGLCGTCSAGEDPDIIDFVPTINFTYTFDYNIFENEGNWNNDGNWSETTPTAAQDVLIQKDVLIPTGVTALANRITLDGGSLTIEDGGQLIASNSVAATVKKTIANAGAKDESEHWYTIASPVNDGTNNYIGINNTNTVNLTADSYDMFAYDEKAGMWLNQKEGSGASGFDKMYKGQGYLYRNSGNELSFVGNTNSGEVTYTLKKENTDDLAGFNLIGNPYPHDINLKHITYSKGENLNGCYILSDAGAWGSELAADATISPYQGFLVQADVDDKVATFHETAQRGAKSNGDNIKFMVANSQYEDVAYALFDKGFGLSKINHRNADIPMLYINQEDADYAIATMSDDTKSFNLNFKAMTTGKYTLSYKADGNFSYLHVIDRLTGEDVDMLLEGEYSFIASPIDSENRFIVRLEYSAGSEISESSVFAYQSGNDIIVNGEGELQIFDMMGRRVLTQYVSGVETINLQSHGVYIFKLNEKTQKIVVK